MTPVQIPAFSCDCSKELCSAFLLCANLISHMKRLALLALFLLCACGDRIRDDRTWLTLYAFHFEHIRETQSD